MSNTPDRTTLRAAKFSRRSIRLPTYDYRNCGAYFVTVCTHQRRPLFADVTTGQLRETKLGRAVRRAWSEIPEHSPQVAIDAFVVMPDHVHGIVIIRSAVPLTETQSKMGIAGAQRGNASATRTIIRPDTGIVGAQHAAPLQFRTRSKCGVAPGGLGAIVRSFKSATANAINRIRESPGAPVWQRNYYDHVVRDDAEMQRSQWYIRTNPERWIRDLRSRVVTS
jgi:REP element-mobilizing transposase RayT